MGAIVYLLIQTGFVHIPHLLLTFIANINL